MPLRPVTSALGGRKISSCNMGPCDRCRLAIKKMAYYYKTADKPVIMGSGNRDAIVCHKCMKYLQENPTIILGVWMD